jgi:AcrR family transcriptional regulator
MALAQPRRTQAQRRSASEEAILVAAGELIAERGVERATLARIGARAGASSGLPIHHFGTKDVLIARVARRAQDRIMTSIEGALERVERTIEDASGLELVRVAIGTYFDLFAHASAAERALIVMWGSTFPSDAPIEGMRDADRRPYQGWVTLIERGRRDGSIRVEIDSSAASVLLLGLTRGVAAILLTEPDLAATDRVRALCDTWITAALATPGTAPAAAI